QHAAPARLVVEERHHLVARVAVDTAALDRLEPGHLHLHRQLAGRTDQPGAVESAEERRDDPDRHAGDERDDHQQFDQREARLPSAGAWGLVHEGTSWARFYTSGRSAGVAAFSA